MLDSSGDGLYGLDTHGRCTLVNRAAAELFGYTTSELVGQPIHDLLHHSRPDGTPYPHAACPILRACGTGHGIRVDDDVFWHKDGSIVNVEYTAHPIVENGLIVGAVVAVRDIRERKGAEREMLHHEQALRASNRTLEGLIEASPVAITLLDADGTVRSWNPAAEHIYGWTAEEVLGQYVPGVPDEKRAEFQAQLETAGPGQGLSCIETRRRTKHGEEFDAAVWIVPVPDDAGAVRYFCVVMDITEQRAP